MPRAFQSHRPADVAVAAGVVVAEVIIVDGDVNATRTATHTSAQASCDARRHQYLVWAMMTSFPTDRRNGDEWSLGSLSSSLPADVGAGRLLTERGDLAELPPPLRPMLIPTLDDAMASAVALCRALSPLC